MYLNKKNLTLIGILCFTLCFILYSKHELAFPDKINLESIILLESSEENNTHITITDAGEIKDLFNSLKYKSRKTNLDSVAETPTNIENYIVLKFVYSEDENKLHEVNYIYEQKGKYYIEEPYGCIWEITKESYKKIITLLKNR